MSKQEENEKSPIYQLSENELIDYADTDLEDGLEKEEAQSRLEQNGYNEIEHEKTPKWKLENGTKNWAEERLLMLY